MGDWEGEIHVRIGRKLINLSGIHYLSMFPAKCFWMVFGVFSYNPCHFNVISTRIVKS